MQQSDPVREGLRQTLAAIDAQLQELTAKRATIAGLLGEDAIAPRQQEAVRQGGVEGTQAHKFRAWASQRAGEFNNKDAVDAMEEMGWPRCNVSNLLTSAVRDGTLVRTGMGVYRRA